jgi:hypothetical protein
MGGAVAAQLMQQLRWIQPGELASQRPGRDDEQYRA